MGRSRYDTDFDTGWAPYVPVAERRHKAEQDLARQQKKGQVLQPIRVQGTRIASSFWGKAWCNHLESFSDAANRLPRGRSYLRTGAVIDLRIETGKVLASVSGSDVYRIDVEIQPLPAAQWQAIVKACAGQVASLVELLQGRLSDAVMKTVTRPDGGLFPQHRQIRMRCSCPDSAALCKHLAAVLYGVGARLDQEPELLFQLRHVDPQALVQQAVSLPAAAPADSTLEGADLAALFGIEMAAPAAPPLSPKPKKAARPRSQPANRTLSAAELVARGVPRHMIQAWLTCGALLRTEQRGIYRRTAQTEARIQAYLNR